VDLVDATRKKCAFLEVAAKELGLRDVAVHWTRIERPSLSLSARAPFDVALARAMGDTEILRASVAPLLGPEGALWTWVAPGTAGSLPWPESGPPLTAIRRQGGGGRG
jgi:16S rRNA G527 N7-methylase RsmG